MANAPSFQTAPFPAPPDFLLNYTNDSIRAGQAPKPPKVPSRFNVFGEEYNLDGQMIPSLTEMEITKFYGKDSWKVELKKLNFSVVAAFLDLIDILVKLTTKDVTQQEFKSRADVLLKHLNLMKISVGDGQEFTEVFNDDDLIDTEAELGGEVEEEKESWSEENDFIEEEMSSNSSAGLEADSPVMDVAVEYMDDDDDDEDDDDDDMLDVEEQVNVVSDSQDAEEHTPSPVEPPSEFVDDEVVPNRFQEQVVDKSPESGDQQGFSETLEMGEEANEAGSPFEDTEETN